VIALEVFINGRKLALAGAEDLVVLSSIVDAVGKLGRKASGPKGRSKGYDLFLSVGGLTGRKDGRPDEHLRWAELKRLKVGDEISVRLRRITVADPPTETRPAGRKRTEREEFELLKARYFKLRPKYERSTASQDRHPAARKPGGA